MKTTTARKTQRLAILAIAVGLTAVSAPALSQSTTYSKNTGSANSEPPRRPTPPLNRFDKMAERLKITPGQQSVWAQYRRAVDVPVSASAMHPPADADAITMLRWRADRAMEAAQRMAAIADATDVLQRSLDGEQRKALNEIVQQDFQGMRDVQNDARRADSKTTGDRPPETRRPSSEGASNTPRPPSEFRPRQ
jgi:hypothetical protein